MPAIRVSASRKRRRLEPLDAPLSPPKRQKAKHSSDTYFPPIFWDNLSKIWLTSRALQELDRRNDQTALDTRPPRRVTRSTIAQWRKHERNWRPTENAAEILSSSRTDRLQEIKALSKHGGLDLSDLRGYRPPEHPLNCTMSATRPKPQRKLRDSAYASSSNPLTQTTSTKKSSPYNRNFQQHLTDYNIFPPGYRHPDGRAPVKPQNLEEIYTALAQPRLSLSPSRFDDEAFERFVQADADAAKEVQVIKNIIPIIEGNIVDARSVSGHIPFTNLDPLTDGTIVPGNPDIYHGSRPELLDRKIRDELSGQIVPSTQKDLPIVPNFFVAAKGPDGSAAVAGRQATYDAALGARNMHSLQSYGQDQPTYDNNAYTVSSIYHNGQLKMYTSHLAAPSTSGGRPEYYMTQLGAYAMTHKIDTFVDGARAYRNGQKWTRDRREEFIRQANARMAGASIDQLPINTSEISTASTVETERVEAEVPTGYISGASPASILVTAVSETEAYTMSQESRSSLNDVSNTQGDFQESDSSVEELVDYTLPAKRFSKSSKYPRTERKRRNVGESEKWSCENGKFRCYKGKDLVKEQNDTPADVWIYFDQGWPGQGEKKWRLWMSATREILYS